jgi:hypothetical protein
MVSSGHILEQFALLVFIFFHLLSHFYYLDGILLTVYLGSKHI